MGFEHPKGTNNSKHSSKTVEHYTPGDIVEAARTVFGLRIGIDLDPASCLLANKTIKANRYFAKGDNSFTRAWKAKSVFLNPPGGMCDAQGRMCIRNKQWGKGFFLEDGSAPEGRVRSSAAQWWRRFLEEHRAGNFKQGVFVGFTVEMLQTTQLIDGCSVFTCDAICFPKRRVQFETPSADGRKVTKGTSPTHANFIAYVGENKREFVEQFKQFGAAGAMRMKGI